MPKVGIGVIARYGNLYRGDSDFFTHCLILQNGECWLLGQGLEQVLVHKFKAPAAKLRQLKTALTSIPATWVTSSYGGYNFITDAEGPNAREMAVYGKQPGGITGAILRAGGRIAGGNVGQIHRKDRLIRSVTSKQKMAYRTT